MKHRAIDAAGDWTFGKGLSNYAMDEAAIELNIATRLRSWVGNCPFAMQDGIDWLSRLDVGQEAALLNDLRTLILQSQGVVGINTVSYNLDRQTRNFTVTYNIVTIYNQAFQAQVTQAAGAVGS